MKVTEAAKISNLQELTVNVAIGKGSCPFACSYCFYEKQEPYQEMSEQVLYASIDFIRKYAVQKPKYHFFGTEPLVKFDLIRKAREYDKELPMAITTNGYLLNDNIVNWLAENDVKVTVYSIDGNAWHNRHRKLVSGEPVWDRIASNFQKLLPYHREWMTARGTWTPDDYDLVGRFKALEELGAKRITIIPAINYKDWDEQRVANAYMELAEYYESRDIEPPCHLLRGALDSIGKQGSWHHDKCHLGAYAWGLLPNGDLMLCHNGSDLSKWIIGNIFSDEINEDNLKWGQRTHLFHDEVAAKCSDCSAQNICMGIGWCAAENYRANKDIFKPSIGYCNFMRGFASGLVYWLNLRTKKILAKKYGIEVLGIK